MNAPDAEALRITSVDLVRHSAAKEDKQRQLAGE
jgi:hypothetical protein